MGNDDGGNGKTTRAPKPGGSAVHALLEGIDFGRNELASAGKNGVLFELAASEDGHSRCYGCTLCEKACPVDCIEIEYQSQFPETPFEREAASARSEISVAMPGTWVPAAPQPAVDMKLFDPVVGGIRSGSGLIEALHVTQEIYGYLPRVALENIADEMRVPLSRIYGVASFYGQFRLAPVGKYVIDVCTGTGCHVAGAPLVVEAFSQELEIPVGGMTSDGLFTLQTVNCVGACALAPVVRIGSDETFGRMGPNEARRLVRKLRKQEMGS